MIHTYYIPSTYIRIQISEALDLLLLFGSGVKKLCNQHVLTKNQNRSTVNTH
jgi:hypothetical protein